MVQQNGPKNDPVHILPYACSNEFLWFCFTRAKVCYSLHLSKLYPSSTINFPYERAELKNYNENQPHKYAF